MAKNNNSIHALTVYVSFSIAIVIVYSIAEFITSTITGISHPELTGCVFAFFGGEVVTAGLIKIFKIRGRVNDTYNG